jgi:transketolase
MEILGKVHSRNLVKWAKDKPDALVMSADLTSSVECDLFRLAYPDRFFSMGIAEQNMMSMAGGMAREGFVPLVHTFAVFIYRRAYDQIAISVAYPNLPVKMFGFLPGVMTPGGATHQAIEDIAVMRALPNMTILECGDATDVESVLDLAYATPGPVYVRMLRGELPRLFPANEPMRLGLPRILSKGPNSTSDITVLSSGICTEEALRACATLSRHGIAATHLHVSTLKPFDCREIMDFISQSKYGVVTMENHTVIGGLGTIVAECMAEAGISKKLVRTGLPDTFLHGASKSYLMNKYGINTRGLIRTVERLTGDKIDIKDDELQLPHPVRSMVDTSGKAEDL